jgi:L-lactate dehydrogenase complex protein LldG
MPSSRDEILASIRKQLVESSPLPELTGPWIEYSDPIAQFASVLDMIGGRCVRVPSVEAINSELDAMPVYSAARQTISRIGGAGASTVDLDAIDDPHQLENIDFALLPSEFAVAENAACWVHDRNLKHRVLYFLCQHLAFVVRAEDVIHNMHQAYERLQFHEPSFGGFIAGPSKTADVEQSLVIGAHGPRSQTVFVVG